MLLPHPFDLTALNVCQRRSHRVGFGVARGRFGAGERGHNFVEGRGGRHPAVIVFGLSVWLAVSTQAKKGALACY